MNILRFDIGVSAKWYWDKNILDYLKERLSEVSGNQDSSNYEVSVKKAWNNLSQENLKVIFNENDLIGAGEVESIEFFIYRISGTPENRTKITLTVVCLFNNENVSQSLNTIIKGLKKSFSPWWNVRVKTLPVKRNNIFLYPCDEHDIIHTDIRVKGAFKENKWDDNRIELIRDGLIILIICICFALYLFGNLDEDHKGILASISASGLFYVFSEIIIVRIDSKYKVVIEDLDSPLVGPDNPLQESPTNLTSPDVE